MKTTNTRHLQEVSRLHYLVARAWLRFLEAPAHTGRDGRPMRPADVRRLIRQCNAFTRSIGRVQLAAARALDCMARGEVTMAPAGRQRASVRHGRAEGVA